MLSIWNAEYRASFCQIVCLEKEIGRERTGFVKRMELTQAYTMIRLATRMNRLSWAWMPFLALWMSGCGIPQLRSSDPTPNLPETFLGDSNEENSSLLGIDEFFDDLILTNLIDQGLAGNQELKMLAQDIAMANNDVLAKSGSYLPFVTIGGGAALEKPSAYTRAGAVDNNLQFLPGQNFPTPLPDFLGAANVSWQIDIWRQLRNARDAATLRYFATAEGRNYVVTRLVAEIAENYFTLMALDKRIENLDRIISLQEQSLKVAIAKKDAGQGNELAVKRFQAEVQKNQSEKLIINQDIIVTENRINFLVGRFPEQVDRNSAKFFDLELRELRLGIPAQLLQNRPDIRQAEREIAAAGLDILSARARFYPRLDITAAVGYDAFNPRYLFITPDSLIYGVAGDLVAPLINKRAIQADYMNANARQLRAIYNYQRTVLNAFTEVINRLSMVENYRQSLEIKRQQLDSLEASVSAAKNLYDQAQAEYIDVLFAQRDLVDARMVYITTKREQLAAVVNTYQALGGGLVRTEFLDPSYVPAADAVPVPNPQTGDAPLMPPAPAEPVEN